MAMVAPELWVALGMFDVVVNDIFKTAANPPADVAVVASSVEPQRVCNTPSED